MFKLVKSTNSRGDPPPHRGYTLPLPELLDLAFQAACGSDTLCATDVLQLDLVVGAYLWRGNAFSLLAYRLRPSGPFTASKGTIQRRPRPQSAEGALCSSDRLDCMGNDRKSFEMLLL